MSIKELREAAGLRQARVREAIGMDKPLYSKLENGHVFPNREDRKTIAALLKTSPGAVATYAERAGDRHRQRVRVSFRPRDPAKLRWALEVLGLTATEWLRAQERNLIRRATKKAPGAGGAADGSKGKSTTDILPREGGGVNGYPQGAGQG